MPDPPERLDTHKTSTMVWWHKIEVGDRIKVEPNSPPWRVTAKDRLYMTVADPTPGACDLKVIPYTHAYLLNTLSRLNGGLSIKQTVPEIDTIVAPRQKSPVVVDTPSLRASGVKRKGIDDRIRVQVYERDRWTCQACKWSPGQNKRKGIRSGLNCILTVDHIQPYSRGGADHIDNYETLCLPCNNYKDDAWPFDWAEHERTYW